MLENLMQIEVEIPISITDKDSSKIVATEHISVFYDSRDYSYEDICELVDKHIESIMQGDLSNIDNNILIVDSSYSDRIHQFLVRISK